MLRNRVREFTLAAVAMVAIAGCTTWTGICADYDNSFHGSEYGSFEECDRARRGGAESDGCSCTN